MIHEVNCNEPQVLALSHKLLAIIYNEIFVFSKRKVYSVTVYDINCIMRHPNFFKYKFSCSPKFDEKMISWAQTVETVCMSREYVAMRNRFKLAV